MNKLETFLVDILTKLDKEEISLKEARKLFNNAERSFSDADDAPGCSEFNERFTKKSVELAFEVLFKFSKITDKFAEKWQKGEVQPTHKELILLARNGDKILLVLTYFQARYFQIDQHLNLLGNNSSGKQRQIIKTVDNIRDVEEKFLRQVHQNSFVEQSKVKKEFPQIWVIILSIFGGIVFGTIITYLVARRIFKVKY